MFQQHHKLSPYGSPYPPEYHDYNRPNGPWIRPRDESGWVPEQPDPRVPLPPPSAIRPVPSPRENSSPVHPYPPPAEIVPDRSPDADLHPSKPIAIPPLTIASTTASTTAEALAANRRTLAAVGRDRRTPIACDTCHQRKLRCMEGDHSTREPCARCRKKGVECTWSATRLNTKRAKAAARVAEVRKQTTLIPSSASNSPSKDVGELVASGGQIRRAGSATGSAEEMRKGSTDDEYGDDEGNGVVVARRGRGSFDDGVRNMNLDGTRCAENNDEAFHAAEKNNLECSAARKNSSNKDESKKKKRKKLSERARYIAELEAKIEAYEEQLRTQQQQDASASTGGNRPTTGVDHTSSNKKRKRDSLSPAYRETSEDEPNPTAGFSANAGIGDQREMKSVPPKVFGLRMSSTYSWMNMGHTAPDSLDSPTSCDLGISPTLASHLVDVFLGCAPFHVMAINPSELKHTLKLHSKPDSVFLLHCVFAIAARFSDHPELRAIATSSGLATEMTFVWTPGGGANDPSVAPHYKRSIYHIQAHYFAQRARALLAHQLDHPTANTVTGLALLAVALYGAMDAPVAWMLVLMGIRMAKYLELERVPRDEGSSAPSSSADGSAKKSLLSKRVREAAGMVEFSRNPGWYERKKGRLIWYVYFEKRR
ncbi:hypothetical protein BJ742DRAFT_297304 [Cladochytrium replicatum]|nr:hypothetical protein BJ742DRAFT_297304 [Cladochytrium replicatum]